MDELLANLSTDNPMFDAPSVLGPAFDMDTGFMTEQPDALYTSAAQPTPSPPEMDYLAVDPEPPRQKLPTPRAERKQQAQIATSAQIFSDISTTLPLPNRSAPVVQNATPLPLVPNIPDTPTTAERRRLKPLADAVISESWRQSRNSDDFVRAVRARLPMHRSQTPASIVEDSSTPSPGVAPPPVTMWQLPEPSEGALLDALFAKLVKADAASTRLMGYLSHSLVAGIVSQRAIIATCLKWIAATERIEPRVLQAFACLLVQILPHYRLSATGEELTAEVREFLAAFTMVVKCVASAPNLAPQLVSVLEDDRVVALVRACARRVPAFWPQIHAATAELETAPGSGDEKNSAEDDVLAPRSAYDVAPVLRRLVRRLKKGLAVGVTSLETIAASFGNINVPDADATLPIAMQTAYAVAWQVFGTEIANSLKDLWSRREEGADYQLLLALEKAAKGGSSSQAAPPKCSFRNKVMACEAIVRFLCERSAVPSASEQWQGLWGGKERLKRLIRDAIPQVKTEIRTELGALLVSMAVTCCAVMCLGPSLRMNDANDGVDETDPAEVSMQEKQNEEVEEAMGELIGFAVGSLEEAAMAEEVPAWRSFGLWLLLLMSRSGSMLRASGCEHVRAAEVLRTWCGMPTGTPGTHTAHASGHKHSSQSSGGHQHGQGSSSAMTEGVTMFSQPASLAIIDVSDVSGSDETLRVLCNDLVQ